MCVNMDVATYCTRINYRVLIFHVFDWQENSWGINFRGQPRGHGRFNRRQIC